MSTEGVIAGAVVGVTVGVISAVVAQRSLKSLTEATHQEELVEAHRDGYNAGWEAANKNPNNIRARFREMFGETETGEEGTAFKTRQRKSS